MGKRATKSGSGGPDPARPPSHAYESGFYPEQWRANRFWNWGSGRIQSILINDLHKYLNNVRHPSASRVPEGRNQVCHTWCHIPGAQDCSWSIQALSRNVLNERTCACKVKDGSKEKELAFLLLPIALSRVIK